MNYAKKLRVFTDYTVYSSPFQLIQSVMQSTENVGHIAKPKSPDWRISEM